MTRLRAEKVMRVSTDIPPQHLDAGPVRGRLAVVAWGSTYGPISRAVSKLLDEGVSVAHIHLRYLWPLPQNLAELLSRYDRILVPEMNTGQLLTHLRSQLLIEAKGLNKISGQPFKIEEIETAIRKCVEE